jgi:hypothetical protein
VLTDVQHSHKRWRTRSPMFAQMSYSQSHVLQGRPHVAGVPHNASHAAPAQPPPPKAAAKPGRKPKPLPAAGALATSNHSTPGLQPSRPCLNDHMRPSPLHVRWNVHDVPCRWRQQCAQWTALSGSACPATPGPDAGAQWPRARRWPLLWHSRCLQARSQARTAVRPQPHLERPRGIGAAYVHVCCIYLAVLTSPLYG